MNDDALPFGKFKGQSVALVAAARPDYARWLTGQPVFRTKHPALYSIVRDIVARQLVAEIEASADDLV